MYVLHPFLLVMITAATEIKVKEEKECIICGVGRGKVGKSNCSKWNKVKVYKCNQQKGTDEW